MIQVHTLLSPPFSHARHHVARNAPYPYLSAWGDLAWRRAVSARQVLAPFAVDQAACLRADGEQRVDSSASSDSVGWTVTDTCTTATKIRRVRPPAVKMSRNAKRWLTSVPTENLVPPLCTLGIIEDLASAC